MKSVYNLVQTLAFAGIGVFLLLHNHENAGGFCLFLSAVTIVIYTTKKEETK